MQKLKEDEVQAYLDQFDGWSIKDDMLTKDFGFKGFSTAIEFINALVPVADKLGHHPVLTNSYNRVSIGLKTHSAKGITKTDFIFARQADEIADQLRR